jgi:uncharacterized protein with NRDE domain
MCLVLFGIDTCPGFPLVLAANRDEFYNRPTAPMAFWEGTPRILAGRDLEAAGTWMGIAETGCFAALTNYRDMATIKTGAPSRGQIIPDLLASPLPVPEFMETLDRTASAFNGFNLIAGKAGEVFWYSNMDRRIVKLSPGIHGLSNHLMDTPWPKVKQGKEALARCIRNHPLDDGAFFDLLTDSCRPEDHLLPDTGIGLEWERILSPRFIQSPTYGTRSSTLMRVSAEGKIQVTERSFAVPPDPSREKSAIPAYEERNFSISPGS